MIRILSFWIGLEAISICTQDLCDILATEFSDEEYRLEKDLA